MNPPDPEPVEVILDGTGSDGEIIEQTDLLDSRDRPNRSGRRRSFLLAAIALIALGIGVWRVLPDDTNIGDGPEEASDVEETGTGETDERDDTDETDETDIYDSEAFTEAADSSDAVTDEPESRDDFPGESSSPVKGGYPLFGEEKDWVVAVSVGDDIFFVDTTTGSVRSVQLPQDDATVDPSEQVLGDRRSLEVFGDRLVVGYRGRALGVPMGAGASIDFGPAAAFYVDGDGDEQRLVVIRQAEELTNRNTGQFAPVFDSQLFGPDGEAIGEVHRLPEYPSLFAFESVMSGLVGTYRLRDEGFERVSTGYVVAAGDNHALVSECDDALVCSRVLIDLNDGTRSETAELPDGLPFDGFGSALISPDGRWLVTEGGFGRLVELATGEAFDLDPEIRLAQPLTFSPDGKYAVAVRTQNLLVLNLETNESRSVTTDNLTTVNERSVAVIFEQ